MMLFTKLRDKIDKVIAGQCITNELLAQAAKELKSSAKSQDLLIIRQNQIIDKLDRLARAHEEVIGLAKSRETALEELLIEKANEARVNALKLAKDLKREEQSEETEYDKKY